LSAKCRVRRVQFRWVKAESSDELTQLTHTIDQRIARYLERQGFLVRDAEYSYLTYDGMDADHESFSRTALSKFIFVKRIQNLFVGNSQISHRHSRVGVVQHLADFLDRHAIGEHDITPALAH